VANGMNWNRVRDENRRSRINSSTNSVSLARAYEVLSFFLREKETDERRPYLIAVPDDWKEMTADELIPYFEAHRVGTCKVIKSLANAEWVRISRATAESVGMKECSLCHPYSNG